MPDAMREMATTAGGGKDFAARREAERERRSVSNEVKVG